MVRALLLAAAALLLTAAAKPASVDYRLGVSQAAAGQAPLLEVEVRLRGDADGETRLALPDHFAGGRDAWRFISDLSVKGATVTAPDSAHRVLRHRPGAKLTLRYRVQSAYAQDADGNDGVPSAGPLLRPGFVAALGPFVFVTPEGRDAQPATFQWGTLPKGWAAASDLDPAASPRPLTVAEVPDSLILAAPGLTTETLALTAGTLRLAFVGPGGLPNAAIAKDAAALTAASRAFWNDPQGPYFVGVVGLTETKRVATAGGIGLGDAFVLYASPHAQDRLAYTLAHEGLHSWIPGRLGTPAASDGFARLLGEGLTDFVTTRILLRSGLETPAQAIERMAGTLYAYDHSPVRTAPGARIDAEFHTNADIGQLAYQRGFLLALKWDEAIRLKTGGKANLDTALLRMRDHARQFPAGQGPDLRTGLVSAVWVTAGLDIRPDITRYADAGAVIDLPDEMFDGCLQARVTVSPGFDPGFDTTASFAAKIVKGVRRRGPAWTGGLRDGMILDAWTFRAGDTTSQVELTVHTGRGKPRRIAYWPYGDNDQQSRKLQITPGTGGEALKTCGRKMAGL